MRGDFSAWNKDRSHNFRGTLHQQGRVLLDRDWNAQTEIIGEWQETSARDTFGADVAAVPADAADSFKVTAASFSGGEVTLAVNKGHLWADGLLVESSRDLTPIADYLNDPAPSPAAGAKDVVILETWLEELSAFQQPELLLEPALGGVDTTERIHTAFRFRLYRMQPGDTCDSVIPVIRDDFEKKAKLKVELKPTTQADGDCPVVLEGGFTGFEHRLYRIEIADTDKSEPYFKWSHFNGGLVGTGVFDNSNTAKPFVTIHGNKNAILYCGSKDFYLEALEFDDKRGYWKVIYAAEAALGDDGRIDLSAANVFKGAVPDQRNLFFRLWNGIAKTADFTTEQELPDDLGIQIQFGSTGTFTPSDYWTFEVRVGDMQSEQLLIDDLPPQGILHHRVPLAEISWVTNESVIIEDCRQIFQPLTRQKTCCTYRVGDGKSSHGDFHSIQAAIDALPKTGGEICILPGTYHENAFLYKEFDRDAIIVLKGCGDRTKIIAQEEKLPVITVAGVSNLSIESMYLVNPFGGGVLLLGDDMVGDDAAVVMGDEIEAALIDEILKKKRETGDGNGRKELGRLSNINLERLRIDIGFGESEFTDGFKSGIRMHTGYFVSITGCRVFFDDVNTENPAVFLSGDDIHFEHNQLMVRSESRLFERPNLTHGFKVEGYSGISTRSRFTAEKATGGLQLAGGCERVRVIDNLIFRGIGNGITLGSVDVIEASGIRRKYAAWNPNAYNKKGDCNPNTGDLPDPPGPGEPSVGYEIGPPLYDILIERNRIFSMGRNGIGVEAFSKIKQKDGSFATKSNVSVTTGAGATATGLLKLLGRLPFVMVTDLVIIGNRIENCVNRKLPLSTTATSFLAARAGISLAMTDGLAIRDNDIVENGPTPDVTACGIFVLFGMGIDISRNRLINNGARAARGQELAKGLRGGIVVFLAFDGVSGGSKTTIEKGLVPSGEPALRIHENVVSVPVGTALASIYKGSAIVTENKFQSLEKQKQEGWAILPTTILLVGIDGLKNAQALMQAAFMPRNDQSTAATTLEKEIIARQRIDGALMFANNQILSLHPAEPNAKDNFLAASAITIFAGGDLSFMGNQCFTEHPGWITGANAILIAATLRAVENSWFEIPLTAFFSAVTLGLMNTTTNDQSTHCLLTLGSRVIETQNLTLEGNCSEKRSKNLMALMALMTKK